MLSAAHCSSPQKASSAQCALRNPRGAGHPPALRKQCTVHSALWVCTSRPAPPRHRPQATQWNYAASLVAPPATAVLLSMSILLPDPSGAAAASAVFNPASQTLARALQARAPP